MAKPNIYQLFFTPTPELTRRLKMAHMIIEPKKFIKRNLLISMCFAIGFSTVVFFVLAKQSGPLLLPLRIFPLLFLGFYIFLMRTPDVYIRRREREINQNIVFATRYIILKMDSGQPLLNSMISASESYGVGAKFFREIVDDVNLGKPIEQALEDAHKYNASHLFQLVLRQILNALKTGIDISGSLRKILDEITREQQIEFKVYSRKLNSLVLFYLIMACVLPSLGISLFLVVGSMINLTFDIKTYALILSMLFLLQLFFIGMLKSVKPMVEI